MYVHGGASWSRIGLAPLRRGFESLSPSYEREEQICRKRMTNKGQYIILLDGSKGAEKTFLLGGEW